MGRRFCFFQIPETPPLPTDDGSKYRESDLPIAWDMDSPPPPLPMQWIHPFFEGVRYIINLPAVSFAGGSIIIFRFWKSLSVALTGSVLGKGVHRVGDSDVSQSDGKSVSSWVLSREDGSSDNGLGLGRRIGKNARGFGVV